MRAHGYWLLALLLASVGCGRKHTVRLPPPSPAIVGASDAGVASWYGHPYHGRRTSNGEVYDMDQLTAAHLSLPFGTWVRDTNLSNGRSTEVRINDRGPFVKDRVIDISRAAAREIAMIGPGTARVRVEVIATPAMAYRGQSKHEAEAAPAVEAARLPGVQSSPAPTEETQPTPRATPEAQTDHAPLVAAESDILRCPAEPYFGVQVGTFANFENAMRLQGKLMQQYGVADVIPEQGRQGPLYRVIVGRTRDYAVAGDLLARLQQNQMDGFVARVDGNPAADCL